VSQNIYGHPEIHWSEPLWWGLSWHWRQYLHTIASGKTWGFPIGAILFPVGLLCVLKWFWPTYWGFWLTPLALIDKRPGVVSTVKGHTAQLGLSFLGNLWRHANWRSPSMMAFHLYSVFNTDPQRPPVGAKLPYWVCKRRTLGMPNYGTAVLSCFTIYSWQLLCNWMGL